MSSNIDFTRPAEPPPSPLPRAEPCVLVIFGATGDLTQRKLIPALFSLANNQCLASDFQIIGIGRREMDDARFREQLREGVAQSSEIRAFKEAAWNDFASRISYLSGNFLEPDTYQSLAERLAEFSTANRLFYLATAPSATPVIIQRLADVGLEREDRGFSRLVVEKPFGHDLESARELNRLIAEVFEERQVYRIDHYLGKETVQNVLFFRFGNALFESVWNRNHVEYVEITAAESLGVGSRAGYYQESGALRDMVANHLLQLLALTAMDAPVELDADSVNDKKAEVWRSIRPMTSDEVASRTVRAQYVASTIDGASVPGWHEEPNVPSDSRTETYVALDLRIDNWRWAGVPFYLRTGKRLARQVTEIAVHFRQPPLSFFPCQDCLQSNVIILRIQPDEGISLTFGAKEPGTSRRAVPVSMDFCYHSAFAEAPPSAYAVLLLDALRGDLTQFTRCDGVEAQWRIMTPIETAWAACDGVSLPTYAAGSEGPHEADGLLEWNGHAWRSIGDAQWACQI
ncbi:glucose-6-phosphate 1-dehydrogenase [Thiorhodococcus drewsii AZ1]|uniref:Glucose-6-phosphate 1-dehydrogenase n=1 Tax=Thiorhodococcus drewsii AZ1 TaxID=765913 RepID=G2E6K0_9GAMM|nr:glucose-6-phosphate dehydrogenase [Thiorhodococcus drewsii]EGV28284.1 glucose-6-phosphate 1-dehydrogenase [Thiorhodococcus drewsii AZ1]